MSLSTEIESILTETFAPLYLELIDETAKHRKHSGFDPKKSHFLLKICSNNLPKHPLEAHRLIHQSLGTLWNQIHAFSIKIIPSHSLQIERA